MASTLAVAMTGWLTVTMESWKPSHSAQQIYYNDIVNVSVVDVCFEKNIIFILFLLFFKNVFFIIYILVKIILSPFLFRFSNISTFTAPSQATLLYSYFSIHQCIEIPSIYSDCHWINKSKYKKKLSSFYYYYYFVFSSRNQLYSKLPSIDDYGTRCCYSCCSPIPSGSIAAPTLQQMASSRPIHPVPMRLLLSLREE